MNKDQSLELSEKIVDAKSSVVKNTKKDVKGKGVSGFTVELDVFGNSYVGYGDTEKDAKSNLVKLIAEQLENGDVIVSDTWAEDNLK